MHIAPCKWRKPGPPGWGVVVGMWHATTPVAGVAGVLPSGSAAFAGVPLLCTAATQGGAVATALHSRPGLAAAGGSAPQQHCACLCGQPMCGLPMAGPCSPSCLHCAPLCLQHQAKQQMCEAPVALYDLEHQIPTPCRLWECPPQVLRVQCACNYWDLLVASNRGLELLLLSKLRLYSSEGMDFDCSQAKRTSYR